MAAADTLQPSGAATAPDAKEPATPAAALAAALTVAPVSRRKPTTTVLAELLEGSTHKFVSQVVTTDIGSFPTVEYELGSCADELLRILADRRAEPNEVTVQRVGQFSFVRLHWSTIDVTVTAVTQAREGSRIDWNEECVRNHWHKKA